MKPVAQSIVLILTAIASSPCVHADSIYQTASNATHMASLPFAAGERMEHPYINRNGRPFEQAPYAVPVKDSPWGDDGGSNWNPGVSTPLNNHHRLMPTSTGNRRYLPPTSTSSVDISITDIDPRPPANDCGCDNDYDDYNHDDESPTPVRGQGHGKKGSQQP